MAERLWLRVQLQLASAPVEGAGLPGNWAFVNSIDYVYAELTDGIVTYESLDTIKELLLTNKKRLVPIAVARCDEMVVWAYATRRYAQSCGNPQHLCTLQQIVLTVYDCLPAVLNSANVHMRDPTRTLKIDVDNYEQDKHMLARLVLCDYAARVFKIYSEHAVVCTQFQLATTVFIPGRDMAAAGINLQSLLMGQLMDALNFVSIAVPEPPPPPQQQADVMQQLMAFPFADEILGDEITEDILSLRDYFPDEQQTMDDDAFAAVELLQQSTPVVLTAVLDSSTAPAATSAPSAAPAAPDAPEVPKVSEVPDVPTVTTATPEVLIAAINVLTASGPDLPTVIAPEAPVTPLPLNEPTLLAPRKKRTFADLMKEEEDAKLNRKPRFAMPNRARLLYI